MSEKLIIHYQITCQENESIDHLSQAVALEQTVEVADQLIHDDDIRKNVVGQVMAIEKSEVAERRYAVSIAYNPEITGYEIPQFLNVLYGNSSIKNNIKIVKLDLPEVFLNKFSGPRYGVAGVREIIGIEDRPLAATALKPMGTSAEKLADMARQFALGGCDIIKDDHGLADQAFCPFEERVSRVQTAIDQANQETGRQTLYFPNIIGSYEKIEQQLNTALQYGVKGILVSPFLIGLDRVRYIAEHYPFIVMTHPAFSGTHFHDPHHGMTPAVLLGTINRLLGADMVVFPNSGGRFGFTGKEVSDIEVALQQPLGSYQPSWPVPAGGMDYQNIGQMAKQYGVNTVYLIGGALQNRSNDLTANTREMMAIINRHFSEKITSRKDFQSACEIPINNPADKLTTYLPRKESGQWQGRTGRAYKAQNELAFKLISRCELVGQYGEKTKFDLRYFQIESGGFSSLEKHVHEHVIIGVEGQGLLQINDKVLTLRPNDIAYVPAMAVHQLRNEGAAPFGFYCIVDHKRDKPQKP